jgi:hypothetical protein
MYGEMGMTDATSGGAATKDVDTPRVCVGSPVGLLHFHRNWMIHVTRLF